MDRREFITKTCLVCVGSGVMSTLLSGCQITHYVSGTIEPTGLSVLQSEFIYLKNKKPAFHPFIIVQHEKLQFPIYLYRLADAEYTALWMKCTHQGSELQASGDHLYCSSHGSEFDKHGNVKQGPAEKNLRTFPVTVANDKIFIDLS
jgi:Rieske Fe-S protein